ncbi:MAG: hypothetical protein ACE5HE_14605, partial [Phycisphaerae bacterium]
MSYGQPDQRLRLLSVFFNGLLGVLKAEPLDDSEEIRNYMRSGSAENNYRRGRWKSFYAILVDPNINEVISAEAPPALGAGYPTGSTESGLTRVYPINSSNEERVWRNSFETGRRLAETGKLIRSNGGMIKQRIHHR